MSDITTTLTQSSTIVGSVSQGNQPQVVRVQTMSDATSSVRCIWFITQNQINIASDVDVSTFGLNDGSIVAV